MATILIVDHLAASRESLVTVLGPEGHRLLEAADGREGLAAARAERPDLVIADVIMPVMDGYELVRQLRLDPTTRAIPIVLYAAPNGEDAARALALAEGVSGVLPKTAEPADVLRLIDRVLSGESHAGTASAVSPGAVGADAPREVTPGRTLAERSLEAQKMEAIGRLAVGVAQDFNNLLTEILGHCELVLANLDPGDPRGAEIAEIQNAGRSAARLTHQLLAFSRKRTIEPTLLDLNALVAGLRAVLGRLIEKSVNVVLNLQPDLAPVKADHGQLEQVLLNLALNARDAMPAGGTLTIETANVELDDNQTTHLPVQAGSYVLLAVTDTGTGMTPEVRARVFEPFFSTRTRGKATGFGLAIVHGIVSRSGGSIDVTSEVGAGTSFRIYFPRAAAASHPIAAEPPTARPGDEGTGARG